MTGVLSATAASKRAAERGSESAAAKGRRRAVRERVPPAFVPAVLGRGGGLGDERWGAGFGAVWHARKELFMIPNAADTQRPSYQLVSKPDQSPAHLSAPPPLSAACRL